MPQSRNASFISAINSKSKTTAHRMNWSARRARRLPLDRLVEEHDLGSMAYYYMGTGNVENEDAISSIISGNSHLLARGGARRGRIRSEERAGHEDHGQLLRWGGVHRILRDGLERGHRPHGARWSGTYRHYAGGLECGVSGTTCNPQSPAGFPRLIKFGKLLIKSWMEPGSRNAIYFPSSSACKTNESESVVP